MNILDRWEQKAMAFSRKTKEKACSMSEITRIRTLIAGEEKNFRSLCTQLGEAYVEAHSQDCEPRFQELMDLCLASRKRSEAYRQEIMQLRKVRPCPSCGAEVPLDFAFCNFCGAKLPEIEPVIPTGFHKCPGCQAVIPDSMKFCNHCGAAQEQAPQPAETEAAPDEKEAPEPAPQPAGPEAASAAEAAPEPGSQPEEPETVSQTVDPEARPSASEEAPREQPAEAPAADPQ